MILVASCRLFPLIRLLFSISFFYSNALSKHIIHLLQGESPFRPIESHLHVDFLGMVLFSLNQ